MEFGPTKQGPFSSSSPIKLEPPGPPFSQMARGALRGSLRASKNQKKLRFVSITAEQHQNALQDSRVDGVVLDISAAVQESSWKVDVARVRLDVRGRLADAGLFTIDQVVFLSN